MAILTYGLVGLLSAGVASLCLRIFAKRRALAGELSQGRAISAVTRAPFLALFWLIAAVLLHVEISNHLAHQDCGFSPDPHVTLPNGYVVGSANTYDGYSYAPGFHTDVPVAALGYVRSLVSLQFSDGYLHWHAVRFKTSQIRHFSFDTRTREFHAFAPDRPASQECKSTDPQCVERWGGIKTRVHNDVNSYWKLYAQHPHYWPNYVLAALIILGEGAICLWTWRAWNAG